MELPCIGQIIDGELQVHASGPVGKQMSRRPARITQADIARAVRAAKQVGAGRVRVLTDGTIEIDLMPLEKKFEKAVELEREIVL